MSLRDRRRALMAAQEPSGPGWTDGVPYDNVQIIDGEYYETNGNITAYSGWSRTDLLPCKGASYIHVKKYPSALGATNSKYNCFFDTNRNYVSNFTTGASTGFVDVAVPNNVAYVAFSCKTSAINDIVKTGITPYA